MWERRWPVWRRWGSVLIVVADHPVADQACGDGFERVSSVAVGEVGASGVDVRAEGFPIHLFACVLEVGRVDDEPVGYAVRFVVVAVRAAGDVVVLRQVPDAGPAPFWAGSGVTGAEVAPECRAVCVAFLLRGIWSEQHDVPQGVDSGVGRGRVVLVSRHHRVAWSRAG